MGILDQFLLMMSKTNLFYFYHYSLVEKVHPLQIFIIVLLACTVEEYASTLGSRRHKILQKNRDFFSCFYIKRYDKIQEYINTIHGSEISSFFKHFTYIFNIKTIQESQNFISKTKQSP